MSQNNVRIRTGDEVMVIAGKDRSIKGHPRRGQVLRVEPKKERLFVDGINIIKRSVRATQRVRQGGIVESPGPIHVSNVMLICPSCDSPTKVTVRENEEGRRVRYCRKCDRPIDE